MKKNLLRNSVMIILLSVLLHGKSQTVLTFTYTGSAQSFTIPCGVTTMHVKAWGGGGSGGGTDVFPGAIGGGGGFIETDITTTPFQVYTLIIGGGALGGSDGGGVSGGAGGFGFGFVNGGSGGASGPTGTSGSGGGGGAGSALFNGATPIVIAGGGGGGSGGGLYSSGGAGGAAGVNGSPAGGSGCINAGTTGTNADGNGIPGTSYISGDGGGGGGGGGGYAGGGGGGIATACDCGACGGAGGTSFSSGINTTIIYGTGPIAGNSSDPSYIMNVGIGGNNSTKGGDGLIVITYIAAPNPTVTLNSSTPSICQGLQTTTLTANGTNTYSWSPSSGLSTTSGSVVVANPLVTTTYTVAGGNSASCVNYSTITVTVNPLPVMSVNSGSICLGQQSATLTASGALTYSWMPASGLNVTNASSVIANPGLSTTYTIVGVGANGCANYTTATVNVNPTPTISVNSATICSGLQTATLTASGASTYTWSAGLSPTSGSVTTGSPLTTSTYTVVGATIYGCKNSNTTSISVSPMPAVTVNSSTICGGIQTATLIVHGAATYTWSPNLNLSTSTGSLTLANPSSTKTYTVIGTNTSGCFSYNTATVTVKNLPVVTVNSASICMGQQTATLSASGLLTYSWTPSSGLSATNTAIVIANPNTNTTYSVGGVGTNGCPNFTTTTVIVNPIPVLTVNSASICLGQQTATLSANGALTYTWNPSSSLSSGNGTSVTGTPTITTHFTVTGSDVNGCVNSKLTSVTVYTIPIVTLAINTPSICIGNKVIITASGADSYVLMPDNITSSPAYTLNPTTNTIYSIVGTSHHCFSTNTASVNLTVYTLPVISAQSNTIINIGQTTTLIANGGESYHWNPTDGLACVSCSITSANPYETTTYIVTGIDNHGCINTDTILVKVDYVCGDFFIPNVFSPNGDGLNDVVNIHGACISNYTLQIFDRWGEMVFETSDFNHGWDGYFRGKPMNTGVFIYKVTGITRDGSSFNVKGNITLLR